MSRDWFNSKSNIGFIQLFLSLSSFHSRVYNIHVRLQAHTDTKKKQDNTQHYIDFFYVQICYFRWLFLCLGTTNCNFSAFVASEVSNGIVASAASHTLSPTCIRNDAHRIKCLFLVVVPWFICVSRQIDALNFVCFQVTYNLYFVLKLLLLFHLIMMHAI